MAESGKRKKAAQDTRGPAHPFYQPPLHHLPHDQSRAGRTSSPRGAELDEWVPAGVLCRIDNTYAKMLRLISFHFLEYEGKCEAGSGDEPRAFVENYCVMLIALFKNLVLELAWESVHAASRGHGRGLEVVCVCEHACMCVWCVRVCVCRDRERVGTSSTLDSSSSTSPYLQTPEPR